MLNLVIIMLIALAITVAGYGFCFAVGLAVRGYRDLKAQQQLYKSYLARN